jgi:TRAP-type mannitol/chloroaromatic compound transport system permease small subunit
VKLFIPIALLLLALQAVAEWLRILLEPAAATGIPHEPEVVV